MSLLIQTFHAAQAIIAAHPVAVHRIGTACAWLSQSFGFLRTLDWAWKKFRPQAQTPTTTTTTTTVTMTKTVTVTMTMEKKQERKAA